VLGDQLVLQEKWVRLENKVHLVWLVVRDNREREVKEDHKEKLDPLVVLVQLDLKVHAVQVVKEERQVLLDHLVKEVC